MAWLCKLFFLVLTQIMVNASTFDRVTVQFQLNSYAFNGTNFEFLSPTFRVLVNENTRCCSDLSCTSNENGLKDFTAAIASNNSRYQFTQLRYENTSMEFLIPRQEYNETLTLLVKQNHNNSHVSAASDLDDAYYCKNVSTTQLVTPSEFTLKSPKCTLCSITVTMSATCPAHYFGAQCNTYCLFSDDDTNGHFNCGVNGEKLCLQGYEGENCTVNIQDCTNDTCHHGTCIDHVANFSCNCYTGYTGRLCDNDINDCENVNCKNGGTCNDGIGTYTCSCVKGYDGPYCENNINDCENVGCKNGGTCNDGIGTYSCSCAKGYDGLHCENNVNECENVDCQNGGRCNDGIGTFNCSCEKGYDGIYCGNNINDCAYASCKNGGTCNDGIATYTCSCAKGYDGIHCENNINDCANVSCKNGGTCNDGIGNYTCSCNDGYRGLHCEQRFTTPTTTLSPSTFHPEHSLPTRSRYVTVTSKSTTTQLPQTTSSRKITVSLTPKSTVKHEQTTSSPKSTVSLSPGTDNESSPQKSVEVAPIAGGAAGGVLVLVVAVVLVVKCRRKQPRQESQIEHLNKNEYNATNAAELHSNGTKHSTLSELHSNGTKHSAFHQNGGTEVENGLSNSNEIYHIDEKTQL